MENNKTIPGLRCKPIRKKNNQGDLVKITISYGRQAADKDVIIIKKLTLSKSQFNKIKRQSLALVKTYKGLNLFEESITLTSETLFLISDKIKDIITNLDSIE